MNHTASEADNGSGYATDRTGGTDGGLRADDSTTASARWNFGIHFTNVTIPAGSTITAATFDGWPMSAPSDDPNCDIYCEDVDDSADFSATADVTSRTVTAASTSWVASGIGTGGYRTSPDFAAAVQEVIDRPGWASGNDLCVIVKGKNANVSNLRIESYGDDASHAPRISIDYTPPASEAKKLAALGVG